ncbi:prefoldin subunit beta, partial [Candidatus Woesearchaeota archaeon CG_4_10_14_0_8_um_filter_47_5]
MTTDTSTQQKIEQLQLLEQSMQNLLSQKQTFQSQLVETESAIAEIQKSPTAYKIVGSIMVLTSKDELRKELGSRKEM